MALVDKKCDECWNHKAVIEAPLLASHRRVGSLFLCGECLSSILNGEQQVNVKVPPEISTWWVLSLPTEQAE